ncbi:MAG: NAD(P)/FAD-dependent oxidoreductase [Nevskiaceae bacterium]|nr:MAG: NAD(P)/FAD-dependent oxidoreductase [Nevskiaceae bacterium]TBR72036.1 MAG: NAD(P)/FAD-dependent oxidoreductase [Nevskiaceae bacterium]
MSIQPHTPVHLDAVVVGAGFAGLYMLHALRDRLGLKATVFEAADDVGGTWYWNRYPGARCDIDSYDYSFSFSDEIQQEWTWSEKYAAQPEIMKYLQFVADKLKLRPDINFETRVVSSTYDEHARRWVIRTDRGHTVVCKYYISGAGTLSNAADPAFKGKHSFKGEVYSTSAWPHEPVDFTGKTVGIIGTGASAIQAIPLIAQQAKHLTVFQRTPNYTVPLQNCRETEEEVKAIKANYAEIRKQSKAALAGVAFPSMRTSMFDDTPEQVQQHLEYCWNAGGFSLWLGAYGDVLTDEKASNIVAEFVRSKIRQRVTDPKTAEKLCPRYLYGTKRQPCETRYYETYNRDNVALVDVKADPIQQITEDGIDLESGQSVHFDCLIYATGFDAFTGPLYKLGVKGRGGATLQAHWRTGVRTNLGLMSHGFPNFFMITGPQSPSVLFNMPLGIEQHVEWIADAIRYMEDNGLEAIEPALEEEVEWDKLVADIANATLLPRTDTWYTGSNIPGKPRKFLVYLGGGAAYKQTCDEVARNGYTGFVFESDPSLSANVA